MASEAVILAVDLGTSGMKVALVTTGGKVLGGESEPIHLYLTEAGAGGSLPANSGWVANSPIVLTTEGYSYSMAFGSTTHLYPCDDLDPGDVNSDGQVGLVDLVILHQYLAGNVAPGELPFLAHWGTGDVNEDGLVDGVDLVDLAGWLAGM